MRESDEERFTAFVTAHSATLFRTAYLMTGDYQRAEDLLQTTLVRVYQRWARVDEMDRPVAYARRILVNQSVSWWRRRSSHEMPMRASRRTLVVGTRRRRGRARPGVAGRAQPSPTTTGGDRAALLRGPLRGRDRRDPGDGSWHREEPQPRGGSPAGRPSRGTRRRRRLPGDDGGDAMMTEDRLTRHFTRSPTASRRPRSTCPRCAAGPARGVFGRSRPRPSPRPSRSSWRARRCSVAVTGARSLPASSPLPSPAMSATSPDGLHFGPVRLHHRHPARVGIRGGRPGVDLGGGCPHSRLEQPGARDVLLQRLRRLCERLGRAPGPRICTRVAGPPSRSGSRATAVSSGEAPCAGIADRAVELCEEGAPAAWACSCPTAQLPMHSSAAAPPAATR